MLKQTNKITREYAPVFKPIYKSDVHYSLYVLHGGRFSGKSYAIADVMTNDFESLTDSNFILIRNTATNAKESAYTLMRELAIEKGQASKHNYKMSSMEVTHLYNGNRIITIGVDTHTAENIKSYSNIARVWVEEGAYLDETVFMAIFNTIIRFDKSKMFVSFNPKYEDDFLYHNFVTNKHPKALSIRANYIDNPFLIDSAREWADYEKTRDYELWEHEYMGVPKIRGDNAFIKSESFNKAVDRYDYEAHTVNPQNRDLPCIIGVDPATGNSKDDTAIVVRQGGAFEILYVGKDYKSTEVLAEVIIGFMDTFNTDIVFYDAGGGMTNGVISYINPRRPQSMAGTQRAVVYMQGAPQPHRRQIDGLRSRIDEKDTYLNKRAQIWGRMRDWLIDTAGIDLEIPHMERVRKELLSMQLAENSESKDKIQLMDKHKSRSLGIASPDIADALSLTFAESEERLQNIAKRGSNDNMIKYINIDYGQKYYGDR